VSADEGDGGWGLGRVEEGEDRRGGGCGLVKLGGDRGREGGEGEEGGSGGSDVVEERMREGRRGGGKHREGNRDRDRD